MDLANRILSRAAWSMAALSIAAIGFATPLTAAANDAAYCAQLATLTLKYTGTATAGAANRPGPIQMWAIDHCQDQTAAAIPLLEKTLRDNRVPLPAR